MFNAYVQLFKLFKIENSIKRDIFLIDFFIIIFYFLIIDKILKKKNFINYLD